MTDDPATPPRLVATDLDGTLVRADGSLSPYTREVLTALDERGVPVVVVTARPLRWMTDLWGVTGLHALAVVSNGALVYDAAAGEVRGGVLGIDREVGLRLVAAIRAAVPGAMLALECVSGMVRDTDFVEPEHVDPRWVGDGGPVGPLEELWTEAALKVLVRHATMDPAELRERTVAAVGDLATPTWSVEGLVEISASGVTKASTLARLCAEQGVAAGEVIAFGDMPNDLPMLAWAGTACAMGNAHPSVLEVADVIAPTNEDDGVARVLARVFGL